MKNNVTYFDKTLLGRLFYLSGFTGFVLLLAYYLIFALPKPQIVGLCILFSFIMTVGMWMLFGKTRRTKNR